MKKKLPKIYKGRVNVDKNQKQSMFSSYDKAQKNQEVYNDDISVDRKIKDIFNSPNYVYKADVKIIMDNGEIKEKTIVGRTNNSLITLDDELIEVSKINQIDFLN